MVGKVAGWVREEFSTLEVGDSRLNERVGVYVTQAMSFGDSNPDRCQSNSQLKGYYRMVGNAKMTHSQLFESHNEATITRCGEQELVYLAQDTTVVDLTNPHTVVEGAGPLSAGPQRGFFFHPSYAIAESGVPLGLVDQQIIIRDEASLKLSSDQRQANRRQACFEEKESARWLEILQSNEQLARSLPNTQFVSVADSEADISELFCECTDFPANHRLIIRSSNQRNIRWATDVSNGQSLAQGGLLEDALPLAQTRFEREVSVGFRPAPKFPDDKKRKRKQARSARDTTLEVSTLRVKLAGPKRPGDNLADCTLNIVQLIEPAPPQGEPPIHWVLYTDLPVQSQEQVEAVIKGYCMRWKIELLFKTLKSGLKIEKMRFKTISRYLNAVALLVPVAWRVEYLKEAARVDPHSPCSKYFNQTQWTAIMIFKNQADVDPTQPPTTADFLKTVAQIGGYINKKSQGPPGSQTIWRGMARFDTIVQAFQIFNK